MGRPFPGYLDGAVNVRRQASADQKRGVTLPCSRLTQAHVVIPKSDNPMNDRIS